MARTIVVALLLVCLPIPAAAQGNWDPAQTEMDCRPYADMAADLLKRFNERPSGIGVVGAPQNGIGLMLFLGPATPHGRTFSIVAIRRQDNEACMGNYGTDWVTGAAIERLLEAPVPLPPAKEPTP